MVTRCTYGFERQRIQEIRDFAQLVGVLEGDIRLEVLEAARLVAEPLDVQLQERVQPVLRFLSPTQCVLKQNKRNR